MKQQPEERYEVVTMAEIKPCDRFLYMRGQTEGNWYVFGIAAAFNQGICSAKALKSIGMDSMGSFGTAVDHRILLSDFRHSDSLVVRDNLLSGTHVSDPSQL